MPIMQPTAAKQYVYLLKDLHSTDFKIGIAIDVNKRASSLPESIALHASHYVTCTSLKAKKLETVLHRMFHKYTSDSHIGEGYTEWFRGECYDRVTDFIAQHADLLGCSELKSVPRPTPSAVKPTKHTCVARPVKAPKLTKEQLFKSQRQSYTRAVEQANKLATKRFEPLIALLKKGLTDGAVLGRVFFDNRDEHERHALVFDATSSITDEIRDYLDYKNVDLSPRIDIMVNDGPGNGFYFSHYGFVGGSSYIPNQLFVVEFRAPSKEFLTQLPILVELTAFLDNDVPAVDAETKKKAAQQHPPFKKFLLDFGRGFCN